MHLKERKIRRTTQFAYSLYRINGLPNKGTCYSWTKDFDKSEFDNRAWDAVDVSAREGTVLSFDLDLDWDDAALGRFVGDDLNSQLPPVLGTDQVGIAVELCTVLNTV
ncbi:PREDICTED: uncharacterized protein LOC101291850 [Fragaria vesca subsp. vesca]|uniref:uncharacterized protein LOC101291850 n=1 Tax=Fragaria vesca subsp. vesca TaxID=101020 RepID=UPI0002C356FC|nr:PREDICTED: uncharacterized protein LOC101291850 [Fragaria vesca subsp. vesca]